MERRGEAKGGGGEGEVAPPFLKFLDPPLWIAALTPNFRQVLEEVRLAKFSPNYLPNLCRIWRRT